MSGAITKLAALLQYGAWALTPLIVFTGLFLGAVAAEELTGAAIIPELLGRAVLPVAALLLGSRFHLWDAVSLPVGFGSDRGR
jgi:hypothetical protein